MERETGDDDMSMGLLEVSHGHAGLEKRREAWVHAEYIPDQVFGHDGVEERVGLLVPQGKMIRSRARERES